MQASSYLLGRTTQQEAAGTSVSTTTCLRKLVLVALGVSLLFQTIAIITPGWQIRSGDGYSEKRSLFYFVHCKKATKWGESNYCNEKSLFYDTTLCKEATSCEVKSYSDDQYEKQDTIDKTWQIEMHRIYVLGIVRSQVGVMVVWFCTLIAVIVLLKKYQKREPVPKPWSILATTMAVAGAIMCDLNFNYLVSAVENFRIGRLAEEMSFGFPYSLLFYILACNIVLVSVAALFKCLHDDITMLNRARADTIHFNDMTAFNHARADTGPNNDIPAGADTGPNNDIPAGADTIHDNDMTTFNHARADTGPNNDIPAGADTGPDGGEINKQSFSDTSL